MQARSRSLPPLAHFDRYLIREYLRYFTLALLGFLGFVILFAGVARIHRGRRLIAQATRLEALGGGELDEAAEQEAG